MYKIASTDMRCGWMGLRWWWRRMLSRLNDTNNRTVRFLTTVNCRWEQAATNKEYTRDKGERKTRRRGMRRGQLHVKKQRCPATSFTAQVNRNARGWSPEKPRQRYHTTHDTQPPAKQGSRAVLVGPASILTPSPNLVGFSAWLTPAVIILSCIRMYPSIHACVQRDFRDDPTDRTCIVPEPSTRRHPFGTSLVHEFGTRLTADMGRVLINLLGRSQKSLASCCCVGDGDTIKNRVD
ncbi:hypothetical protein LZ30DRAFT_78173 [Colletotrichum cereale]|nr:hypothetical protein LZ30DRAFT_78173 [Colletotrichum cereale]